MCNVVVFSCLAVASTAAGSPARRRNFVDPGYSSWSRCVEVRESDDACTKHIGFRLRPRAREPAKFWPLLRRRKHRYLW